LIRTQQYKLVTMAGKRNGSPQDKIPFTEIRRHCICLGQQKHDGDMSGVCKFEQRGLHPEGILSVIHIGILMWDSTT